MAEPKQWTTVGIPEVLDLGYGKFIEVSKRTDGKNTGIMIANGTFGLDKDGNCDKKVLNRKNTLYLSTANGGVDALIGALQKFAKK